MTKKRCLNPGKIWWEALCDFHNELHEHVEKTENDELRFQTGRLFRSLIKRIKAEATGKDQWVAMHYCYRFVTKRSLHLGYDEARRLHEEEMAARGSPSPSSFCSRRVSSLKELTFRVGSIVSWMEAQESFSVWLIFQELRPAWHGDLDKRARALQACYLSQLPQRLLTRTERRGREVISADLTGLRIGTNYDNKPWDAREWQNILKHATRLTEKKYDCTELEKWLWWCYPVFRRYGWNTREVRDAAIQRGLIEYDEMHEANFRRRMLTMGVPLSGIKQKQDRTPPLRQFVGNVQPPDFSTMWEALGGFLTKKN